MLHCDSKIAFNMLEISKKYINTESKFIEVMGYKVHYRDEGSGFPLILIHGSFSSLHTFDEWTKYLKKDFRVIRLDLPGFGLTGYNKDTVFSVAFFSNFINAFADALKLKKFHIGGNSLGGWIVWEYTTRNSKRVDKMVLINAAGFIKQNEYPLPFVLAQTPMLRNVFRYTPKSAIRKFLRQVFKDQSKVTDEVVDRYYDLFHMEGNVDAFIKIANSKFDENTDQLKTLKNQTLILWGKEDEWIHVNYAYKFYNSILNSSLIVYEEAGHVPMEEIPRKSAADARLFLM